MEQPDVPGAEAPKQIDEPAASQFALDDFDIATSPAPLTQMLGLPDAVVSVRRRSTGDERLYPSDEDWVDSLFNDLAEGRFGA